MTGSYPPQPAVPITVPPSADVARRLARSPFLVALDIDGTLSAIAPTPKDAVVPEGTREILGHIAGVAGTHLAFVTGRAAPDGQRMVGVRGAWVIGNHGMERIDPSGALHVDSRVEHHEPDVARAAEELRRSDQLGALRGVAVEDKRWTLSVHTRLADRSDVPRVERVVREVADRLDLHVYRGKEIFEVRPSVEINKGTAVLDLARLLGVLDNGDARGSLFYAGDDRTDEDAFQLLRAHTREAVTVHVGGETVDGSPTAAEFVAADQRVIVELLEWLRDGASRGGARANGY